jgi:ubiquinone/menaquinone biosynthesis C-methylase UbiE
LEKVILSPNYTVELMLFYTIMGLVFTFLLSVKTSNLLMGLILSLSIILIGSEYWETPIFLFSYLQVFGYQFPKLLSIINHFLMILIFAILASVAGINATKTNALALAIGPVLSGLFIYGLRNAYLARFTGLAFLFMVTLEAISMKGVTATSVLNVKDYYRKGEYYDWVSDPKWLERVFHRKRERDTVKIIGKYGGNSDVLDVGCGTGLITRNLKGNVKGLDINFWNISRAKANAPNASFYLGDCEDMPEVQSNSMDLVVFTETLEHVPNPEQALGEILRVLKPNGVAVISVPSQSLIWHFRKYLTTTHPHNEPFHRNFSKQAFLEALNGFKLLEFRKITYGLTFVAVVQKP